ncbi:MAG: exosortase/archaeosortase family protein [Pseudomonadota bacterium]
MYQKISNALHSLSFNQHQRHIFVVFCVATIAITSSWIVLIEKWLKDSEGYSHGSLILLISMWLTWKSFRTPLTISTILHRILSRIPRAFWLFSLIGSLLIWAVCFIVLLASIEMVFIPIIILCVLGASFGTLTLWRFLFPIGFLFFAIPIWNILIPILQSMAVWANQIILKATAIPAYIDGIHVTIPYGKFVIEDGCSGLRYLIISLTLATLYCGLYLQRWRSRWLLIGIAIGLSVFFNWIRILLVIYIGYYTKMQSSIVDDHETFGWIIYTFMLIILLLLARWIENRDINFNTKPIISKKDISKSNPITMHDDTEQTHFFPIIFLGLFITCIYGQELRIKFFPNAPPLITEHHEDIQHRLTKSSWPNWAPSFQNEDKRLGFYSKRFGQELHEFYVLYETQKQNKELFNSTQEISQFDIDWKEPNAEIVNSELPPFQLGSAKISSYHKRIYAVAYRLGNNWLSPQSLTKDRIQYSLQNWIQGNRQAEAFILMTQCSIENCEQAEKWIQQQWERMFQ